MSTTINDVREDFWDEVTDALNNFDDVKCYKLAQLLKECGDDEEAERLLKIAREFEYAHMVNPKEV